MARVRFRAGLFFPSDIKAEIFSASITEFKEVRFQDSAADFTVTVLHSLQSIPLNPTWFRERTW